MQRLAPDRAQDPPLWTLFPNKISPPLSLVLGRSFGARKRTKSGSPVREREREEEEEEVLLTAYNK